MDRKEIILEALETLRKKEIAEHEPFKARAYKQAIQELSTLSSIRSMEDVRGLKGIGTKIHAKLEEIFATGELKAAERAKEVVTKSDSLLHCYGIGPAKLKELQSHGITTIAQLREAVKKDPTLLSPVQQIGLTYYEPLLERIPRAEMEDHSTLLHSVTSSLHIGMDIVGSYRRGAPTSGDIDCLLKGTDSSILDTVVEQLDKKKYLVEVLAHGKKKVMAIIKLKHHPERRLDLLLTPPEEYPFALTYFTGSDRFNIAMRKQAQSLGFTLNEHALTTTKGTRVEGIHSEKDLFKVLKIEWKNPEDRHDI